jgi:hypothetical protein
MTGEASCYKTHIADAAQPRDLMAPDTEPTDEELALVMREARDLAVLRRAKADAWIAAKLKEATLFAEAHSRRRTKP